MNDITAVIHNPYPAKRQSDFFSSVIHELRNPLSVIMNFSHILRNEKHYIISQSERDEYLKDISDSASDLNKIIYDLVDISSIHSENFSVDLSNEIDVDELITRSIRLNRDFAASNKIILKKEINGDITPIRLDAQRIKQIFANLISNAIKYSPQQTEIKIIAGNIIKNDKKYLKIIVSDQGFGMNEEQVQIAFEKYGTIKNPNSETVDSFGLGLPIAKQLVESQGGSIEMKSEIGKGTQVVLKFPYLM